MTYLPSSVRRALPGQSRRSGFTLLEVMLAMGILVVGMTMVLSLFTFGAAMSRTAELRANAATAVDAVIADLEATLFPLEEDGSVGEPVDVDSRPLSSAPGVVYSARTTPNPDDPDQYRVDVELTWVSSGVKRAHKFKTLMSREMPFGERLRRRYVEGVE